MEVIEDPHSAPIHVVSPLARSYFLLTNCVQSLDLILMVQPGTSSIMLRWHAFLVFVSMEERVEDPLLTMAAVAEGKY